MLQISCFCRISHRGGCVFKSINLVTVASALLAAMATLTLNASAECVVQATRRTPYCPAVTDEPDDCQQEGAAEIGTRIGDKSNVGVIHRMSSGHAYYCLSHEYCVDTNDLKFTGCSFKVERREADESPGYLSHIVVDNAPRRLAGQETPPPSGSSATSHIGTAPPMTRMTSNGLVPIDPEHPGGGGLGSMVASGGLADAAEEARSGNYDTLPRLDVTANCKQIALFSSQAQNDISAFVESCLNSEQQSYDQLKSLWPTLGSEVRKGCLDAVVMSGMMGPASSGKQTFSDGGYSTMLTCARQALKDEQTGRQLEDTIERHKFKY